MAVPARINLVTLGVEDIERERAFYRALGWVESTASVESTAFFPLGGTVLALWGRSELARDAGQAGAPAPLFRDVALAINVGTPEQVGGVLEAAVAAGGTIARPAGRADWGGVTGYFADPEGHLWEVAYNPAFPIRDDGTIALP